MLGFYAVVPYHSTTGWAPGVSDPTARCHAAPQMATDQSDRRGSHDLPTDGLDSDPQVTCRICGAMVARNAHRDHILACEATAEDAQGKQMVAAVSIQSAFRGLRDRRCALPPASKGV